MSIRGTELNPEHPDQKLSRKKYLEMLLTIIEPGIFSFSAHTTNHWATELVIIIIALELSWNRRVGIEGRESSSSASPKVATTTGQSLLASNGFPQPSPGYQSTLLVVCPYCLFLFLILFLIDEYYESEDARNQGYLDGSL